MHIGDGERCQRHVVVRDLVVERYVPLMLFSEASMLVSYIQQAQSLESTSVVYGRTAMALLR